MIQDLLLGPTRSLSTTPLATALTILTLVRLPDPLGLILPKNTTCTYFLTPYRTPLFQVTPDVLGSIEHRLIQVQRRPATNARAPATSVTSSIIYLIPWLMIRPPIAPIELVHLEMLMSAPPAASPKITRTEFET